MYFGRTGLVSVLETRDGLTPYLTKGSKQLKSRNCWCLSKYFRTFGVQPNRFRQNYALLF